ncbi:hypothetical protein QUF84_09400 [Fictibacillus enclensis]|uniref:hypothetical protein n=1 Tax=Fictibacillus enclensis TaxID=1017270 RepID=UPI0025A1E8E2|nr:hypothetical protein [Fictibacillus enclensis]MDM5337429.1 hypothetical protein [Fictibacillus enclensis]
MVILAASSNGSEETHAKSNSQPSNHQPTKNCDGDLAKARSKTKTSENTAEPKDSQKDPAKTSDENKGNQKDKFLKKLNIMEEAAVLQKIDAKSW